MRLEGKPIHQDEVRALHFECNAKDQHIVKPTLKRIYSSTGEGEYPLRIKLCLIPKMGIVFTRSKIKQLHHCQAQFEKYIIHIVNWEVADLDTPRKSNEELYGK